MPTHRMIPAQNGCRAFTLVELLVVVGIVVLVAGLFLPAMLNARSRAAETVCVARLRQIGSAIAAYVQDNNGEWPRHTYFNNPTDVDSGQWSCNTVWHDNFPGSGGTKNWVALGRLYGRYLPQREVFFCPSDDWTWGDTMHDWAAPPADQNLFNSYCLRGYAQAAPPNPPLGKRFAQLKDRALVSCFFLTGSPDAAPLGFHARGNYPVYFAGGQVTLCRLPELTAEDSTAIAGKPAVQTKIWDHFDGISR
jgi:type II secretory pathway pseudopilin PulG